MPIHITYSFVAWFCCFLDLYYFRYSTFEPITIHNPVLTLCTRICGWNFLPPCRYQAPAMKCSLLFVGFCSSRFRLYCQCNDPQLYPPLGHSWLPVPSMLHNAHTREYVFRHGRPHTSLYVSSFKFIRIGSKGSDTQDITLLAGTSLPTPPNVTVSTHISRTSC